jgi:tetratricopeptide (TPR) repeat protein
MFGRLLAALLPRRKAASGRVDDDADWGGRLDAAQRVLLREALAAETSGRTEEAERLFARARALDAGEEPDDSAAQHFHTRGLIRLRDGEVAQARRCFELAHRLLPNASAPLGMLGFCGYFDGDTVTGRSDYDRALAVAKPAERGALRINRLIDTLPQIAATAEQLRSERAWFERELGALLADPPKIADPLQEVHRTVFYLGYQGGNDRALNTRLARLFLACTPSLGYVAPHALVARTPAAPARRLRVGVVSMFLNRHSVGAWYNHLLRLLIEGGRFDCTLFTYMDQVDDALRGAAEQHGRHVFLERTLDAARTQIEAAQLDLLVYTDVAMHPFPYFLAMSRLARVQALLVGHPCTSGIPTLDWFISNVHQDRAGAQPDYSERLARLPVIPVWVAKTAPPARPLDRAALGWTAAARIYLCPMMLQKMHPEFDWALAEILRRDPVAEVVLFADREHALWQVQLEERFEAVMPDVAMRISFRPFAPKEEFLSLLLAADCVLDPFHFSGGVTTYVALSLGVAVITLPGELFRSRMTAGMLAQAGVEGCVATSREHYVELALAHAAEPARRAALKERILAAHPLLFETGAAVEAVSAWIDSALEH